MRKKRKNNKRAAQYGLIILLFVFIAIVIAGAVSGYLGYRTIIAELHTQAVEINTLFSEMDSQNNGNEHASLADLEIKYLGYYESIDQKAESAINKIIAFIGIVFTATVVVNTVATVNLSGAYERKIDAIEKQLGDARSDSAKAKVAAKEAQVYTKKTKHEQISELSNLIRENPDDPDLYFARGFLYDDIKAYDDAERDYKAALSFGGSKRVYYNAIGVLNHNRYSASSKKEESFFKKAKSAYLKAIDIAIEENSESLYDYYGNLACLFQDHGDYSEALSMYEKVLDNDDQNATIYHNRAISLEDKGEDFYVEAYADYSKSLQIDPDDETVRFNRADIATKLYEKTHEEVYYKEAMKDISIIMRKTDRCQILRKRLATARILPTEE